jgi:hypothetical protein
MNRRSLIAAFAALLALPASASPQAMKLLDDPTWLPRLRITPFVGILTAVDRTEEWQYRNASSQGGVSTEMQIASGPAVGLNADLTLRGSLGVSAALAFASRDEGLFGVASEGDVLRIDGNNVFLARLGAGLVLHESESALTLRRLNASVHAGGVVMHERPKSALGTADFVDASTSFGLNGGVTAEVPFHQDRFAVQVGVEDNFMWWSDSQSEMIAQQYFIEKGNNPQSIDVSVGSTQTWLMRAGFSVRFR